MQENDPVLQEELPMPTSCPRNLDSPLVPSGHTFEDQMDSLGLELVGANILDDVRFLTMSITSPKRIPRSKQKIQTTATWLHNRLDAEPAPGSTSGNSEDELIVECIRIASLIYSRSIMKLVQISKLGASSLLEDLYTKVRRVNMTRWKRTPGIFLFIMLVLCPSSGNDTKGRWIRRKMAVAGLSIGFEDFLCGIWYLRAFMLVQTWITSEAGLSTGSTSALESQMTLVDLTPVIERKV
jgi:hypothetical protein